MRRRNHYKFTGKKHSKRGGAACVLAVISMVSFVYLVFESFLQSGNGSVYLGSAGVLSLVVALIAFIQAVKSLKEEDTFRGIPVASVLLSILAAGAWITLYAAGFLIL